LKITVNIIGGLGNQMFQYAFAYSVSRKLNQSFALDISDFETYWHPYKPNTCWHPYQLNVFQIEGDESIPCEIKFKKRNLFNRVIKKIKIVKSKFLVKGYYQERHHHFDKDVFGIRNDVYFIGYWQSESYFKEYKSELLKKFTLKKPLCSKAQAYKEAILSKNTASLHVRRGDYANNKSINNFHGVCSLEYYQKAVKYITYSFPEICFYIFSDDLDWAKTNFNFIKNKIFVESNGDIPNYEEMHLMSLCKHNIIANSSFSWWGAWLNKNDEKIVIAPEKWFNDTLYDTTDIAPKGWVRL